MVIFSLALLVASFLCWVTLLLWTTFLAWYNFVCLDFALVACNFGVLSRKSLSIPMSQSLSTLFSPSTFLVSDHTFRSLKFIQGGRERERRDWVKEREESERVLICWFSLQMLTLARIRSRQSQELELQLRSLTLVTEIEFLKSLSATTECLH